INDLMDIDNAAYLLKYDSVYGIYPLQVSSTTENLIVQDQTIAYSSIRDPLELPWKKLGVDIVIESTGIFTKYEDAKKHIEAGANTVVLSGPSKSEIPTVVHGVNTADGKAAIFSCASCTTNNISPIIEILGR